MIRIYGKGLVSTWRPFESGGGATMRTSDRESENVTVLDQIVIVQHMDGFWETYPLANCAIIWHGKPTVMLLTDQDQETLLPISGKDHTLADELATHTSIRHGTSLPMGSSNEAIQGSSNVPGAMPQNPRGGR